ncbi:MAG: hypothetical protein VCA35_00750 [Roseibacillus sp.]
MDATAVPLKKSTDEGAAQETPEVGGPIHEAVDLAAVLLPDEIDGKTVGGDVLEGDENVHAQDRQSHDLNVAVEVRNQSERTHHQDGQSLGQNQPRASLPHGRNPEAIDDRSPKKFHGPGNADHGEHPAYRGD